jgi:ankyrin repeat protein
MTRLLLEAGADTCDGIWPNRDATSPRTIAEERGYDEIVALMTAHEEKRGARSVDAHDNGVRRLRDAMMTGGEEAVIAVFESEPTLAGMCPPDGVTMLHRAAQYGLLRVATWLLEHGADVNTPSQPDFWRWKGRTPLEFAVWEYAADSGRAAREAMAALLIERGAELTPLAAAALGRWGYLASCAPDSLQGKAVLQAAVRGDRPDVLRRLLDMGLDPNERMQLVSSKSRRSRRAARCSRRSIPDGSTWLACCSRTAPIRTRRCTPRARPPLQPITAAPRVRTRPTRP